MAKILLFKDLFEGLQKRGIISRKRQRRDSSDSSTFSGNCQQIITDKDDQSNGEQIHDEPLPSAEPYLMDEGADKENIQSLAPKHTPLENDIGDKTPQDQPRSAQPLSQSAAENKQKRPRTHEERRDRNVEKHTLKPPCQCKKLCVSMINEDRRIDIQSSFWDMEYSKRRAYIFSSVKTVPKKRVKAETKGICNRKVSRVYILRDHEGQEKNVCKTFFVNTLGYNSDKIISITLNSAPESSRSPPYDKRGKHAPKHKLQESDHTLIEDHIHSFNPCISHYRRAHAPHRKYLPPELTIREMFANFVSKYPDLVRYETYRRVLAKMNISFDKLGEEECEICIMYENHQHDSLEASECSLCIDWKGHIECARISRKHYQQDATSEPTANEVVLSVDMQKIIMLPRLPGVKASLFTRRLVLFHQTFAPLGIKRPGICNKPTGIAWHEGISGMNADDVTNAYSALLHNSSYRDCANFVFWADNCAAQNKNWTLYTALVSEVNMSGGPDSITIKYLERGHTFMSADSFHAQVEKGMRARKNLYDFNNFSEVIQKVGNVIEMNFSDFRLWESGISQGKYTNEPLLSTVQAVRFVKGSTLIHWKTSLENDDYQSGEFLRRKVAENILRGICLYERRDKPHGVSTEKRNDIIQKLCPLMPINRLAFWEELPINNESQDLIDSSS